MLYHLSSRVLSVYDTYGPDLCLCLTQPFLLGLLLTEVLDGDLGKLLGFKSLFALIVLQQAVLFGGVG